MIQLNPDQTRATQATDDQYSVIASAGAGKTRVLVEKFVHLVIDKGVKVDEILSITFTKKAAAEMKNRIVDRFRDLNRLAEAQIAETGPISTIHSFCERLLRENAIAAQIDPRFEIIDESLSSLLQTECIQSIFHTKETSDPLIQNLLATYAGKSNYLTGPIVGEVLRTNIAEVMNKFRTSDLGYEQIQNIYESPRSLQTHILQEMAKTNLVIQSLLPTNPSLVEAFAKMSELNTKDRGDFSIWFKPKFDPEIEEKSINSAWALGRLALTAWNKFESELNARQQFDFNLLEGKAIQLVSTNAEIHLRIQKQFYALLVDEAQDVNPAQFKLLKALGIEHQMFVGDPQQSIYAFRGSDPKIFAKRASHPNTIHLKTNYRSTPNIIEFVNFFFSSIWPNQYGEMDYANETPKPLRQFEGVELWELANKNSNQTAEYVEQLISEGTLPGEIAILANHNNDCDNISIALREKGIPTLVLGKSKRFYARMETRDLANALTACSQPSDDFALAALLTSPYVDLSYDALVLCLHNQKDQGLLKSISHIDLSALPEDAQKLNRFKEWFIDLIQIADRLPAWEIISELFHQSPVFENVAKHPEREQIMANMRKLHGIAIKQSEALCPDMASIFRQTVEFEHRENEAPTNNSEDAIRIMTIHNAKGLEFPTVVLSTTIDNLIRRLSDTNIEQATCFAAIKTETTHSQYQLWLDSRRKTAELEDKLRVLYVAMTRAQSKLCLTVSNQQTNHKSFSNFIRSTLKMPSNLHPSIKVRKPAPSPPVDSNLP